MSKERLKTRTFETPTNGAETPPRTQGFLNVARLHRGKAEPNATPEAPATPSIEQPLARAADTPSQTTAAPKSPSVKKTVLGTVAGLLLAGGAWWAYDYVTVGRFIVSTDDAYVGADMAIISPKVPANVAEVPIVENQSVKQGQTLIKLDDGDYRLALDQAEAKLATQNAMIATFDAQIKSGEAAAAQARAQLDAAKATVVRAEADYERTNALSAKDWSTKASLDAAVAVRDSARAQVKANEAAVDTADANVALLHAQRIEADRVAKS